MRGLLSAERRPTTVFPTGDPAGTVATCTAGLLEFSATLSWNRVEDLPQAPTLPALPETARCSVVETDDPAMCRRGILGEILALSGTGPRLGPADSLALLDDLSSALRRRARNQGSPRRTPLPRPRPPPCRLWHSTSGTPASRSGSPHRGSWCRKGRLASESSGPNGN